MHIATFDVPRGVGGEQGPKGMVILRITFINNVCQHNLLCVIVVITRMVEALVYGMKVLEHHDLKSYTMEGCFFMI
jgi:hypothetical protein